MRRRLLVYLPRMAPIKSRRLWKPCPAARAILEYWSQVARTQQNIQFGYEVLAVTADVGIARWWASFVIVPPGLQTSLDGIFLISLDGDGSCTSLREWWHKEQNNEAEN